MAKKTEKKTEQKTEQNTVTEIETIEEQPPSRKRRILKLLLILLLIAVLVIGGFFVGIYLRIFDTNEMNEKMGLYNLPIIGQYFVKPAPKDKSLDIDNTTAKSLAIEDVKPAADPKTSKPVVLTKAEIEKQMKAKDAAERKRVSKLARLYNEMKPEDAASILDALDDDTAIAILQRMDEGQASQVLAKFDADKSARITKIMYSGVTKKLQAPSDVQNAADGGQTGTQTQTP